MEQQEKSLITTGKRIRKAVDRESIDELTALPVKRRYAGSEGKIPYYPRPNQLSGGKAFGKDELSGNICIISNMSSIVTLSRLDRAPQLQLYDDLLECSGCEGGYRMVRATNGVHSGSYYYEVEILHPIVDESYREDSPAIKNSHTRIGWSTRQGDLQAPVGYDKYSFGYGDVTGSKIHDSVRYDNYGESYSIGDIIGCYIKLDDYDPSQNHIRFFKNGQDQGVAYQNKEVSSGLYFPAVSLYMKAHIRVNFGPTFIIKPDISGFLPVSEVQPLSLEDRKVHEQRIANIKEERLAKISS